MQTVERLPGIRIQIKVTSPGDLFHGPTGGDRGRILLQDRGAVFLDGMIVMILDQQPIGPLSAVAVVAHPDQDEATVQPFALERELEVSLFQGLFR